MFCIKKETLEKYYQHIGLTTTKGDDIFWLIDEKLCEQAFEKMDAGETICLQNEKGKILSMMSYDPDCRSYREHLKGHF